MSVVKLLLFSFLLAFIMRSATATSIERVIAYHVASKHHFHRPSKSLGYMDWANQPDPFRRFDGSYLHRLNLTKEADFPLQPLYDNLYQQHNVTTLEVSPTSISRFMELSLGITAWKKAGASTWALRSNPSSGNLHPTEGYVIARQPTGFPAALYHYAPREHGLELRASLRSEDLDILLAPFPKHAFLVGLSSVYWREAWKYGERAFRYCNHDIGHALASIRISAAALGWGVALLDGCSTGDVGRLLGTDRATDFHAAEEDHPDCLLAVWPLQHSGDTVAHTPIDFPLYLDSDAIHTTLSHAAWHGVANRLSKHHEVDWEIIDDVAVASTKLTTDVWTLETAPFITNIDTTGTDSGSIGLEIDTCAANGPGPSAEAIIRQRRSGVSFDGHTYLSQDSFYRVLSRVVPVSKSVVPWDLWPYAPTIHLIVYLHRVEGLTPGLYCLLRDETKLSEATAAMTETFKWERVDSAPQGLPLYLLQEGDCRPLSKRLSCNQDIAADGAFSLGMLAEFEDKLHGNGAWWYTRMFW
jgi:SagB-type dehydrogenase family enzyme